MSRGSSFDLSEVLDKIDVEAYLDREGIEYRETHGSSGLQFNLKECPKCGGDRWKVFLNAESGLGNCFSGSCEAHYNKFSFIRAHTGLGGRELMEHIKAVSSEMGWRPPRKTRVAITTDVASLKIPHSFEIPIHGRNLSYLANRGIGVETARYFHLRFCKRGLFKYKIEDRDCYMVFDNRVIIPVFDLDGVLVSFQGRDITGEAEKKYLFPPGFASTGEHLFNGHNVHNTHEVIVGEGVFDVMAQKIALDADPNLRHVVPVGTFGKHLSVGQIAKFGVLMERGVKQVTMMWDSEIAAIDAMVEAGLELRRLGLKVRIALLPPDKDPNEVPPSEVRNAYWSARELTLSSAASILLGCRAR